MVFLPLSDLRFLQCCATRMGDAVDTKGEILPTHPDGESGTSSYGEEGHGDHDIATYATFFPLPYRLWLGC